jgi:hypothetical protein
MVHVARRLLGAFVVLAIVAGATLALSSRPRLQTDRRAVERDWSAVRPGLNTRYALVNDLAGTIDAADGPPNPIVQEVSDAYAHWKSVAGEPPVATAISAANDLEGLARRLEVTVKGSPILDGDKTVTDALHAVTVSQIPATAISALNDAVSKYEKDRGGALRRLIAGPLGFDAIPRLALATGD